MGSLKLSDTAAFFATTTMLLFSHGYGLSPSIAHAKEPFSLPQNVINCIHESFACFLQSIPPENSYKLGSDLEHETACDGAGKVLLRLRLFKSSVEEEEETHERGEVLRRRFEWLLKELKVTLKLRYEWAVIMSGHYWMEYYTEGPECHYCRRSHVRNDTLQVHVHRASTSEHAHDVGWSSDHGNSNSTVANVLHRAGTGSDLAREGLSSHHGGNTSAAEKDHHAHHGTHAAVDAVTRGSERASLHVRKRPSTVYGTAVPNYDRSDGNSPHVHTGTMQHVHAGPMQRAAHVRAKRTNFAVLSGGGGGGGQVLDCLPRRDVLVSHNNNGVGADRGLDVLAAPHSLVSQSKKFVLTMQSDCNLGLFTAAGVPLWSSRTRTKGRSCHLSLLRDGNLVITNNNKKRIWASGSSISCASVFMLMVQNDGNVVISDMLTGLPIWATGTNQ